MKYIKKYLASALVMVVLFLVCTGKTRAATLKFDQSTVTVEPGKTFDLQVVVDAGSDQTLGVDSYVVYDPQYFEPQNITNGTFFPIVYNNTFSGKVYIAGLVSDPATFKTGSGTLATITFKAVKNASANITFLCSDGVETSKILKNDAQATNVIQCATNGLASVTIGTGGSNAGGTTPTISTLPKTGYMDSINKYSVTGAMLLLLGIGAKLLLL